MRRALLLPLVALLVIATEKSAWTAETALESVHRLARPGVRVEVGQHGEGGRHHDLRAGADVTNLAERQRRRSSRLEALADDRQTERGAAQHGVFVYRWRALEKSGLRDRVIVMVGGAPVTQEYADAVGADGYAADASTAVRLAKALIENRRSAAAPA